MQCMKCGREIEGAQVFCDACLENMAQAPVKPGTPVTIPTRPPKIRKLPTPPQIKPEEQILKLRRTVHRLRITIAVLVSLLVLTGGILSYQIFQNDEGPAIGQNYSTVAPIRGVGR